MIGRIIFYYKILEELSEGKLVRRSPMFLLGENLW